MPNVARVVVARDSWKKLAVRRRKEAESKARQAKKWRCRYVGVTSELAEAKKEILLLKQELKKNSLAVIQLNIRVYCVFLFFLGAISCRAVPRILMFLNQVQSSSNTKIPHWSSISNWVCRAGLGLLQSVKPWDMRPWIAIIDISTVYSMKKALVVLRVPLDHFLNGIGAPTLAAAECIGIELENEWNYDTIFQSLERIFKLSGHPTAIVKDGGYDLKKGVSYWLKKNKHCGQISDIGHIVANTLKHMYAKNNVFLSFLKLLNSAFC